MAEFTGAITVLLVLALMFARHCGDDLEGDESVSA